MDFLTAKGGSITSTENWGLKKLAYPIQNKKSAFYYLIEFTVDAEAIDAMEAAFRRDERVMRFLTVKLDKHALAWAEKEEKKLKQSLDHV